MKDKEKQIMKLMKDKEFVKIVKLIDKVQPFYVETIALQVYKHYQPKLPKDARVFIPTDKQYVILSRKEYELLTNDLDKGNYGDFESGFSQGSKETAEKILKDIITKLSNNVAIEKYWEFEDFEYSGEEIKEVLNEIAQQFGVKIKE
jgi:hypothetical protein